MLVSLTVFLSYRFASRLIAYLGETGTAVFLRLSSFILLCVGVAIIWSGAGRSGAAAAVTLTR